MGSEKKRKRRESEVVGVESDDAHLSEKKKAKKAAKAAAKAAAAAAAAAADGAPEGGAGQTPAAVDADSAAGAGGENVTPLVSPIAAPMADCKLSKRAHKLVEAAAKAKALRRGIKEVVLALRKGDVGVCFIAGDVFPVEVIAHLPLLCEEASVPYCFVPRKSELGVASLTKRPTSVVLVTSKSADKELSADIDDCRSAVAKIQTVF